VLLHGCSGVRPHVERWAALFRREGYASFVLDRFSGRAVREVCSRDGFLSLLPSVRVHDAVAALALRNRFRDQGSKEVKAFVSFYPWCDEADFSGALPLLLLLGEKDHWTEGIMCSNIAKNAREYSSANVEEVLYKDAAHAFDSEGAGAGIYLPQSRTDGRVAFIAYNEAAHRDSIKRVLDFLAVHLRNERQ
jgi:dienelactone hydrolase